MRLRTLFAGLAMIPCLPAIWTACAQSPLVPIGTIIPAGIPRGGEVIEFTLRAVQDPGLPYQVATSLGTGPIPIDGRSIGLTADPMFFLSACGLAPRVFERYAGVLDENGVAFCRLRIPSTPAVQGLRLHTAFVTFDPGAPRPIRSISTTASFSIVR